MANPHHEFLKRYTVALPALRRFVMAHVPDYHEAEDTLQRTVTVLWDKYGECPAGDAFTAWAFGVARREVLHARRGAARSKLLLSGDLAERFEKVLLEETPSFDERRRFLDDCMAKLPEKSRRALDLKYRQDKSTEVLAESLASTVNAVRILLCRARQAVGECMERALRRMQAGENSA